MKTILFLEWNSFGNEYIIRAFRSAGYEVAEMPFPRDTEDTRRGSELTEAVLKKVLQIRPSFVFSFNYFPVAAMACKAARVKYVSWVYDNPYIMLYSQTIFYETNRVFVFDSQEVERLNSLGAEHVYYMPMAAAVTEYDALQPGEKEHQRFDSDVTFIGSMYSETRQHMFRHLEEVDAYTKGFLYGLMEMQKHLYGVDILEQALTEHPEIVEAMRRVCPVTAQGDGLETVEWTLANYFLARKVTAIERREILQNLSELVTGEWAQKNRVIRLFTPECTDFLPGIQNGGRLDYYTEMPMAMKCARINLNITLKSIHAGMPLRAMDILGCGGFLLTNYQADYLRHFVPGEDFVYYESISQVPELIAYYLEHEQERAQIAANGHRKAKELFTYENQVQQMLKLL